MMPIHLINKTNTLLLTNHIAPHAKLWRRWTRSGSRWGPNCRSSSPAWVPAQRSNK